MNSSLENTSFLICSQKGTTQTKFVTLFIFQTYSTGGSLRLLGVDFVNSGAYSCEVIADTTFHTLIETKEMLVIGKQYI
jgi:hypothetical protein